MSIKGQRIGEYHVHRRLGVGGMAEVYAAERRGPAGFRRAVALKVLRPHLALLPAVVERFTREARLAATLRHPNLVPVIDFGVEGGVAYLVMELVDGPDLRRAALAAAAAGRPLPPLLAVHVALQVCRGLGHAHRQTGPDGRPLGLVHRDVSPQNILLSRSGEVRLTDFGIATAARAAEESASGALRGKLAYLAPEQIEWGMADARADLFALGVVLWELLAGRRLFLAPTDAETLARVRRCEVPLPPSPASPGVPEPIWTALAGVLVRDPAARYPSAEAMAAALAAACPEADRGESSQQLAEWLAAVEAYAPAPAGDQSPPPDPVAGPIPPSIPGRSRATPTLELPTPALPVSDAARSAPHGTASGGRAGRGSARSLWRDPVRLIGQADGARAGRWSRRIAPAAAAVAALGAAALLSLPPSRPADPPKPSAGVAAGPVEPGPAADPAATTGTRGAPGPDGATAAAPGAGPATSPAGTAQQPAGSPAAAAAPATPAEPPAARRRSRAAVIVVSRPAGAGIELDGRAVGRTPRRLEGLRPGEPVVVRLRLDGYRPAERTVTPAAGEVAIVEVQLDPAFGALSVDALPWAEIWLDGRHLGPTPLFGRQVPAGPHTLRLVHPPTGRSVELEVHVEPDGETRRRIVLAPPVPTPASPARGGSAEADPVADRPGH